MENKTLTDEIYAELVDGLKTGLDWRHFLAKHGASKGPLYNAIARFFNDMEPKVRALNEVQTKLDQAGLKLESLDQRIKEADEALQAKNQDTVALEEEENTLKKQIEALESNLQQKSDLLEQLQELEKLGFGVEKLTALWTILAEIGSKRGLKPREAVNTFFTDLEDYDAKTGFERETHRLETISETKKLEVEKWQAEADSLARRHKDLSDAIAAVQSLAKHGVKREQIISWNEIVSKLGGAQELLEKLEQYKSVSDLLASRKSEIEDCSKKVAELSAEIKALNEQKIEIEGAINSLSSSGVKKITEVSDKVVTGLKSLSASGMQEVTKVSEQAVAEVKSLLDEIRVETGRLANLKAEAGKLEKELIYARYLTTGDEAVIKSLPKDVVIAFLGKALSYFKLNELNPAVSVPDELPRSSYRGSSSVFLLDLLAWAEVSAVRALQTAERRTAPVTQ